MAIPLQHRCNNVALPWQRRRNIGVALLKRRGNDDVTTAWQARGSRGTGGGCCERVCDREYAALIELSHVRWEGQCAAQATGRVRGGKGSVAVVEISKSVKTSQKESKARQVLVLVKMVETPGAPKARQLKTSFEGRGHAEISKFVYFVTLPKS